MQKNKHNKIQVNVLIGNHQFKKKDQHVDIDSTIVCLCHVECFWFSLKQIPKQSYTLHTLQCAKRNWVCDQCGKVIPLPDKQKHIQAIHTKVNTQQWIIYSFLFLLLSKNLKLIAFSVWWLLFDYSLNVSVDLRVNKIYFSCTNNTSVDFDLLSVRIVTLKFVGVNVENIWKVVAGQNFLSSRSFSLSR